MKTLGNIIWHFPFLGFFNAVMMFILGGLLVLTVIAAPIGFGLIQYGRFFLAPFSYEMIDASDAGVRQNGLWKCYSLLVKILYYPVGVLIAIYFILFAACLLFTIIGIPVGLVYLKSIGTILNPVNKVCVSPTAYGYSHRKCACGVRTATAYNV